MPRNSVYTIIAVFAIIMLAINLFVQYIHLSNVRTLERQENDEYEGPRRGGIK